MPGEIARAFRTTLQGENVVKHEGIVSYLSGEDDMRKEDLFVNMTLYRLPGDLVRELKFACKYPGGISEALQDLMKNAVKA